MPALPAAPLRHSCANTLLPHATAYSHAPVAFGDGDRKMVPCISRVSPECPTSMLPYVVGFLAHLAMIEFSANAAID